MKAGLWLELFLNLTNRIIMQPNLILFGEPNFIKWIAQYIYSF